MKFKGFVQHVDQRTSGSITMSMHMCIFSIVSVVEMTLADEDSPLLYGKD